MYHLELTPNSYEMISIDNARVNTRRGPRRIDFVCLAAMIIKYSPPGLFQRRKLNVVKY
jgi:hypothetical protein